MVRVGETTEAEHDHSTRGAATIFIVAVLVHRHWCMPSPPCKRCKDRVLDRMLAVSLVKSRNIKAPHVESISPLANIQRSSRVAQWQSKHVAVKQASMVRWADKGGRE